MIMCEQLSNYFGKEKVALERERKLTRLEERLSKYEQVLKSIEVCMSLIGEFR